MSAPSYKTHDPKGWCGDPTRGAAMGRGTWESKDKQAFHKLTLCNVELDSGGYDRNGTYFGSGGDLWWYASEDGEIDAMLRAGNRREAERQVFKEYPNAIITPGDAIKIPMCDACGDEEVARDGDVCERCNETDET